MKYIALLALLLGCSAETQELPPGISPTDASSDTMAPTDTTASTDTFAIEETAVGDSALPDTRPPPLDTASCNDLEQKATPVAPVMATGYPTLNGGTIADGTYVMTKWELYEAPPPSVKLGPWAFTLVVSGGTMKWLLADGTMVSRVTATMMPAPLSNMLQLEFTCPPGAPGDKDKPRPYHATPAELILAHDDLLYALFFRKL